MKKLKEYHYKELLNDKSFHSVAAISINAINEEWKGDKKPQVSIDCDVNISDCSRVITLDMNCNTEEERENAYHKIDTIIRGLMQLRDFIEECEISEVEK